MAQKILKAKKLKVAPKKAATKQERKIVLVGTYREGQLAWIKENRLYNFPVREGDKFDASALGKVSELWLYAGTKAKRHCYEAKFVRQMTREEWLKENPTYAKLGKSKKPGKKISVLPKSENEAYYVFEARPLEYGTRFDAPEVITRVADFGGRSAKIKKAIEQYEKDGKFASLAAYLPTELSQVPKSQLRVCEPWVQMDFVEVLHPSIDMHCTVPEAVRNQTLPLIDLFAGCGGMSLGFELAGFHPVLAVEKDAWASETYAFNRTDVNVVTGDITKILHPKEEYPQDDEVFGIIGGPPCQGFSLSGDRDPKDPRNSLFMDYMRFVKDFKPAFFVMENVPGILSSVTKRGEPVRDVIVSVAKGLGYNVKMMQLDASHYGVPQSRLRVFFVGVRNDYPFDADKLTPIEITAEHPITIRQAISDLPDIRACEGAENMPYGISPANEYQRWCRKGSEIVHNHVAMRHTKRLVARFHVIKYGESAADVPQEHMQRKRGNAAVISGKVYSQNNMRPFPDRPSPTVPASFQSNFVHPFCDRNYTAREGARLQSFPDWYVFRGRRTTMSWEKNLSQYQQIGNAVPPLLAKALGKMIKNYFANITKIKNKT